MKKLALLLSLPDNVDVNSIIDLIQKLNKEIVVEKIVPDLIDSNTIIQFVCPLHKQCTCLENQFHNDQKNIGLHDLEGIVMKELENILYIKAKGSSAQIHSIVGNKIIVSKPLAYFFLVLPKHLFIRISRYHIINIHQFKKYCSDDGGYVIMQNEERLAVIGDYKIHFLKTIENLS